jgi:hypothetical protein
MLVLNIIDTICQEFLGFFNDIKDIIIDIYSSVHSFLNRYLADDVISVFLIALAALIAILIFRHIINK